MRSTWYYRFLRASLLCALILGVPAGAFWLYWYFTAMDGGWREERPGMIKPAFKIDEVSTTAKVRRQGSDLVIHFTARNNGRYDVGMFVGFHKEEGKVGAWLDVKDSVLHIRKMALERPKIGHSDYWVTPGQLILKPGQTYEEDLTLPERVPVDNPAEELLRSAKDPLHQPRSTRPVQVTSVVFHLGLFYIPDPKKVGPDPLSPPGFVVTGASYRDQAEQEIQLPLTEPWTVLDYE